MRIALDIRKINDFGIGTYIRNLVLNLARIDQENCYLLIGHERDSSELGGLPANFSFLQDHTHDSRFWNDVILPYSLRQHQVDILHSPHYRAPRFLGCKSVITIHDCVHILFPNYASSKAD
jgi:hypothetical protein